MKAASASPIKDLLCDFGLVIYLSFPICKMEITTPTPRVAMRLKKHYMAEKDWYNH